MPIRSLEQLRNTPRPEWIWQGFIAPRAFTLFSAYPKVGKTTLLFHMIAALMRNIVFLDHRTRQVPILYISEEPDTLLADRAVACGFEDSWPIGWLTVEPGMTWEKCIWYMKRAVYVYRNPLIIVDTISRFWSAESENDASQVNHAIGPILELVRNSDAAFFGIHHNRKQGGGSGLAVRGSTALTGGVDIIMELSRTSGFDRSNIRRLACESRYGETPQLLQLKLEDGIYTAQEEVTLELEPEIVTVLQSLANITVDDMVTLLDTPETTLRRALTGMVNRGVVIRVGNGSPRSPHQYSLSVLSE